MGFGTTMGIFGFNFLLVSFTLPAFLVAKVCLACTYFRPFQMGSLRQQIVLVCTCLMWRTVMFCSCWVQTNVEGLSEFRSTLGASGRPAVIVANHGSFMDTILIVCFMPLAGIAKIKMLISSHLHKMPIIGTIAQGMGHMTVPFKASGADGSFELDKEKMAERQREMELHVASGGLAGWFPEGTMNRGDPREIGIFRAGGFVLAVHVDVEVWCVAFHGNTACWPRTAAVGGRPSKIDVKICKLCDSSWAYVREGKVDLGDERAASMHLANGAHAEVQKAITEIASRT
eukprot:CAMPEP_0171074246 /NCGR_PEP_ID=MMETSP0766_2-20121228/12014_1 /TAXON_ID=439317 /ORGANISM="Gambierdiscus australes, Strain CAWD 149" /LENGTH=286 /DNA_ID=CAMNT_0011531015 /DNA_START=53 /DNA_END=913 /DNA_ORIENTATION=+